MDRIAFSVIATNAFFALGIRLLNKFHFFYEGNAEVVFYFFSDVDPLPYLPDGTNVKHRQVRHENWVEGVNSKPYLILSLLEENELSPDFSHLYYIDADTDIVRPFDESWFHGEMVGAEHFMNRWFRNPEDYPFDRYPESACYIPLESRRDHVYYYGCFYGGRIDHMKKLCETLIEMHKMNRKLSHEPIWNEESLLNFYFHYSPPLRTISTADFEFVVSDKGGIEDMRNPDVDMESQKALIREHRTEMIWIEGGMVRTGRSRESPSTPPEARTIALFNESSAPGNASPRPISSPEPKRLCIVMVTCDDYDGAYFSIQALRLYHPETLDDAEILLVDNNPDGPFGQALRDLSTGIGVRYVACGGAGGTTDGRNRTFLESRNEYVLCMDSHVFIVPGGLRRLLDYYDSNPRCNDLLQGPMLRDDLKSVVTHLDPVWRAGTWGTLGDDERGRDRDADAFEIPMQDLGLFTCRRDAWPGYNPGFHGFGGEEGYIHEKFRQAGGRALCLPFLRWTHRLARPPGAPYEVIGKDRIRNYFLGFHELGLDTSEMEAHFADHVGAELVAHTKNAVEHELESPFAGKKGKGDGDPFR